MENTPQQPQPKKINWVMIILLIILIPILLLGYKFLSKKMDGTDGSAQNNTTQNNGNNSTSSQNSDFPTGTWYRNDPNVNSKYIFDAPQTENGIQKGQLDMVMDDQSEGKVNYEVIGDGKMRISDPQGSFPAWEMGYSYNSGGQSLEIIAGGQSATYTRNPVYVAQLNHTQPAPTPNNNNTTTPKQNNKVDISKLPPVGFDSKPAKSVNFNGGWGYMSKQEPGGAMSLEIQQNGSQIYGKIYSDTWDANGSSKGLPSLNGEWTISGDIVGNRVDFTIRNGNGVVRGNGTLIHNGSNLLDFKTTYKIENSAGNELFPQHISLIKQ